MTVQSVLNPLPMFIGLDGLPMTGGYVYIGQPNQDPRQYPVDVFFDQSLTRNAAQPLRTTAGYVYRNGSPASLWVDGGSHSLLVLDSNLRQVAYTPVFLGTLPRDIQQTTTVDRFSGTGAPATYTLSVTPVSENDTEVFVGGVYQQKNTYSVSGNALTMTAASGSNNVEVLTVQRLDYAAISADMTTWAENAEAASASAIVAGNSAGVSAAAAAVSALSAAGSAASAAAVSGAFVALTRSAIAALNTATVQIAYLKEAGREGMFLWSSSNNSANVTSDPLQGIYIAPTATPSGASGAWVRVVTGNIYSLEWWGMTPTYGIVGNTVMQAAFNAIPIGGTLLLPAYTVTLSATVTCTKDGVRVLGRGKDYSLVQAETAPATQSYWSTAPLLVFQADGCSVFNATFSARYHNATTGGSFCLMFDSRDTLVHVGFEVSGCRMQNCSEGIIAFADAYATGTLVPVKNVYIHDNEFVNLDYQAISVFGAENVHIYDNDIRMTAWTTARFTPPIRILGAREVFVHHNYIYGVGATLLAGDNRSYGIAVVSMGQSTSLGGSYSRNNRDVYITHNVIENTIICFEVQSCEGTLLIEGNTGRNPISTTALNYFIRALDAGTVAGVAQKINDMIVRGNTAAGFTRLCYAENAPIDRIAIERNNLIGNDKATPATGEGFLYQYTTFGSAPLITRVVGNEMHMKASLIFNEVTLQGMTTNCVAVVTDNWLPFTGGATKIVSAAGSGGKVYTSTADTGQTPGVAITDNANRRFAMDTWTAQSTTYA